MNVPNKPKVLAATYSPVAKTKMFTILVDIPYVLLPELLQHKELTISYKKIKDIYDPCSVSDNPFIPIILEKENFKDLYNDVLYNVQNETGVIITLLNHNETYFKIKELNYLLAPFAYTTCIISGTDWEAFFKEFCPKYSYYEDGSLFFNSKKEFKKFHRSELLKGGLFINSVKWIKDREFNEVNESTTQSEFQIIAEMIYDLYQEADWKESECHIPFKEDCQYSNQRNRWNKSHKK